MKSTELSKICFKALSDGDMDLVRQLCSADMKVFQNGVAMDLETIIGFTQNVMAKTKNYRYEKAVRSETATGFVEEHAVCGTLPDGNEFTLMVCAVGEVKEGKITELREYFDTAPAAGLMAVLTGSS